MSWGNYLVDKENKVLIYCNHCDTDTLENDMIKWSNLAAYLYDHNSIDRDKPLAQFTSDDVAKLLKDNETITEISCLTAPIFALAYAHRNDLSRKDIISEDDANKKEYSSYKVL